MVVLESEEVGTQNRRFGVRLHDGARVEAVLYRGDTLCLSTQVGCAVGCPFCASGANGFARQLTLEELQATVAAVRERGHELTRLTLSGIGEPLHNHDACVAFVGWARGRGWRTSTTTSGGPLPRLVSWLREVPHNGLTLSVHAGTEATRRRRVPRGPDLASLFATLGEVVPTLSRKRRKKIALAYLLTAGEDGADELDSFAHRAAPLGVAVHLYAYNPVATSDAQPLTRDAYERAYERLRGHGLVVRMSSTARLEANGGCGTLVALRAGAS